MKKNLSSASQNPSWAKIGFSKENKGGLGFNPNLNIEDEYVENLLKQIKLIKEKQQQSEGNQLWGVINKTSEPMVKNIMDSNQKYQEMKKNVDHKHNEKQYSNLSLADKQSAIINKLHFYEKKIQNIDAKRIEKANNWKQKQDKVAERLNENQTKMNKVKLEKQSETKKNKQIQSQLDGYLNQAQKQKFASSYDLGRIKNDEIIYEVCQVDKTKQIEDYKDKIEKVKARIQSSADYQKALDNKSIVLSNFNRIQKGIANAEFQLLKTTESIQLAQREKEKEVVQRKRMMEEYESQKKILDEILSLNMIRLTQQIMNRKKESPEIQKGEYQTKKMEKNLDEIKKKLTKTQDSERILKLEMDCLNRQNQKLSNKKTEYVDKYSKLVTKNDKQDNSLSNLRNECRKIKDQYDKIVNAELLSTSQMNQMEGEIMELRQRRQYLTESLDLKEALNQTKLEDLQKMVQKNNDVNDTVSMLMSKWDEIKSFSKM